MSQPPDIPDPDEIIMRFERRGGGKVRVRSIATDAVAAGPEPEIPAKVGPEPEAPKPAHSSDFASVRWGGVLYTFGGQQQRDIVAALWGAWENGTNWMTQEALLEEACSRSPRIDDVFKGHPAWQTMIVRGRASGGPVGSFCLNVHALGA